MSVTTERGRLHTAGPTDRLKTRLSAAKQRLLEEAATQGLRVATSGGPADYAKRQLEDARQLNNRRWDGREGRTATFGQNVDLVGLAIAMVIVAVVFYVGLVVMSQTEQSAELDNDSEFQNASESLTSGIADAYSLSGILFLVLILTGVVGLLLGLRGRRPQ